MWPFKKRKSNLDALEEGTRDGLLQFIKEIERGDYDLSKIEVGTIDASLLVANEDTKPTAKISDC